jgi:hypothetical protein
VGQGPDARIAVHADVAQLVEHHLAKVGVAGSNPVVRSTNHVLNGRESEFEPRLQLRRRLGSE